MIDIQAFKKEHLKLIEMRSTDIGSLQNCIFLDATIEAYEKFATTLTLLSPAGEVICIVGIIPVFKGTGEIFMMSSDLMSKHLFACTRTIKLLFREQFEYFERIQCSIKANNYRALKFIEWLGFTRECLARKYMGGDDYYLYSYIVE